MAIMKQPSSFKELEEMTELFCLLAIFVLSACYRYIQFTVHLPKCKYSPYFFKCFFHASCDGLLSAKTYATTFFASLKRLRIADGNAQIPLLLFAHLHVCAAFIIRFVDGNRVNLIA